MRRKPYRGPCAIDSENDRFNLSMRDYRPPTAEEILLVTQMTRRMAGDDADDVLEMLGLEGGVHDDVEAV